ncbi:hypothetical protein QR680_000729 [Steinernema hermaphroditum]|uniref:Uncharacterized protein n=1 Tax=Steinernema hermaphroditum TaxID=289476 RepID=A0AA39LE56_9BILA|nr:hypothetical protein QR680_000729 [Steinernema hermaphroditum]
MSAITTISRTQVKTELATTYGSHAVAALVKRIRDEYHNFIFLDASWYKQYLSLPVEAKTAWNRTIEALRAEYPDLPHQLAWSAWIELQPAYIRTEEPKSNYEAEVRRKILEKAKARAAAEAENSENIKVRMAQAQKLERVWAASNRRLSHSTATMKKEPVDMIQNQEDISPRILEAPVLPPKPPQIEKDVALKLLTIIKRYPALHKKECTKLSDPDQLDIWAKCDWINVMSHVKESYTESDQRMLWRFWSVTLHNLYRDRCANKWATHASYICKSKKPNTITVKKKVAAVVKKARQIQSSKSSKTSDAPRPQSEENHDHFHRMLKDIWVKIEAKGNDQYMCKLKISLIKAVGKVIEEYL